MPEAVARDATAAGRPAGPRTIARALPVVLAVLLLLAAILLVAGSFLSYATVKPRLDQYASDGDADLGPDRFRRIVWQLRIGAALLAALAASAWMWRRRLGALADGFLASVALEARAAAAGMRRALAAESRLHLGALGLVVVGAVVVRLEFLFQPMRYDEAGTYVHYASQPLYIGLTSYTAPNNHLLNTVLAHFSTAAFGNEPWAIRLPALVAGILLVPATYLAARVLYGRHAALVGAALVATASVLIEFSTNARGYTLVALLFVLLLALGTRLPRTASPAAWALVPLLGALGMYAVPTFLYAFGAIVVWVGALLLVENRMLLRTCLLPALAAFAALTGLLYSPVVATSGIRALVRNPFVEPLGWSSFVEHLPGSIADTLASWHRDLPAPVWIALAVGFAVAVAFHRRLSETRMTPVAGAVVFIPPVLLAQRVVPFERTWLFLLPLYLIAAAAGLVFVASRRLPRGPRSVAVPLAAVALCGGLAAQAVASQAVYRSEDTSTFRDAPLVSAFLERELRPGDRILVVPPADLILEYYLDAAGFDAGRLLYTDFDATRLLVVVKPRPDGYSLPEVIRWRLPPEDARDLEPMLLRRFAHSEVFELVRRNG